VKPDSFLSFQAELFDLEGKRGRTGAEGVRAWMDAEEYRRRIAAEKAAFEKLGAHEKPAR